MSYLLKALEKAEQERQQNLHPQDAVAKPVAVSAHLPKSIVFIVLILLVLTLWQVWPSHKAVEQDEYGSVSTEPKQNSAHVLVARSNNLTAERAESTSRIEASNDLSSVPITPIKDRAVIEKPPKDLSELTAQELAQIPSLNLASHIYSSAAEYRSVVINDQTYKEGDLIRAGLKLEEINQSGIVINIHGQKVSLPKGISWVASQNVK